MLDNVFGSQNDKVPPPSISPVHKELYYATDMKALQKIFCVCADGINELRKYFNDHILCVILVTFSFSLSYFKFLFICYFSPLFLLLSNIVILLSFF